MNNTYYQNTEENFKNALLLCEKDFSHGELIEMLKDGNIPQKQIAALKLDTIKSEQDAQTLLNNLTGQDGKIREVVSMRLKEFMKDENLRHLFNASKNYQVFLDAITDINGNICRNIISAVSNLREDKDFCEVFCKNLVQMTLDLLDIVEKFDFKDGKYKVNKEAFKLYWCLETIYVFWDKINISELKTILSKSAKINEYTIREKTAKILTHDFDDSDLSKIRLSLKNDSNYYVRRF